MKQLTFVKTKTLKWEEVAEPKIELGTDAIVRPFLVARCDLDAAFLHNDIFKKYSIGKFLGLVDKTVPRFTRKDIFKGPFPFGHECIAEIVELGKEVSGFEIGQKVIIPFQISCGICPICDSGLTSQCEVTGSFNMYSGIGKHVSNGGTMSDLLKVPHANSMLIPIPNGMNLIGLASASDNLPDAWSRVAPYLLNRPNKSVLVIGGSAKSIGLYAAGFAVKMTNERVDYLDLSTERIDIANKLGANGIKKDFRLHTGNYDLIVNCTNSTKAIRLAVKWLNPGGAITSANIYFNKKVSVPFFQLYAKNIKLVTGLANPMADIPGMLQFIRNEKLQPELITTHIGDWESADTELLKKTTKVMIKRNPIKA
ncbi:alcohol dehydrogenase catalytic domain-containing protein [Croceitalea sp. MTPC9]|uniref:zinc-dependent alcohol dehydrogenase n=1 Tax=unclassified Croceitalea TaxID=2632280 RepID=UPI002B395711|nr:alcohol dehydrogenase catalytic domain-containing protein [Croceitalea sp. MTPC6]GMN17873.1 alcohol dehydrogenase catalytic domain-containing protein [Croceitalea sp. MTPC9]